MPSGHVPASQVNFIHPLLRARGWQDRPELGDLCNWWRGGGASMCALVGIAPPVDRYDYAEVKRSTKPKFIIHGAEDELIPLKKVRELYAQLQEPRELVVIDRANHLFDGQTSEVGDALEDLLGDFSCTKL